MTYFIALILQTTANIRCHEIVQQCTHRTDSNSKLRMEEWNRSIIFYTQVHCYAILAITVLQKLETPKKVSSTYDGNTSVNIKQVANKLVYESGQLGTLALLSTDAKFLCNWIKLVQYGRCFGLQFAYLVRAGFIFWSLFLVSTNIIGHNSFSYISLTQTHGSRI